jgi:arylsulfatase A-like enzyme
VTDIVESRDIFPTLLEAAGIDGPKTDTVSARSLFDVVRGDAESNRAAISEYLVPQPAIETLRERAKATEEDDLSRFDRALRTIRTARWKFIEASDGSRELYDLESDPDESENVISARPEVAERLRERLVASRGPLERGEQDTDPLDSGTQERLEDLGYI